MAGGIAHDFNNILSAILGNVELAKLDTSADASALTSLNEIEKAGRRARDLVRQILTFSRNEQPKRSPIQLGEVVQETVRLVKVTLPPTVDLRVKVPYTSPPVLADATQVEQALLNVCTNAILSMGTGKGTVSITLGQTQLAEPLSGRLGLAPGAYVTLTVQDTGSGMSEATMERIFEPFYTTRQVGQGTGLGLAVVHGIMQTHQGAINVQSTWARAASSPCISRSPNRPRCCAMRAHCGTEIQGKGKRILYVDDDQALVFLVMRALTRKGFDVTIFTDPLEAQAALEDSSRKFDLLVTDYNMPGYSGLDLLHASS